MQKKINCIAKKVKRIKKPIKQGILYKKKSDFFWKHKSNIAIRAKKSVFERKYLQCHFLKKVNVRNFSDALFCLKELILKMLIYNLFEKNIFKKKYNFIKK